MNTPSNPRFRHSAQFPWFVLAVAAILVTALAAAGVWFWQILPMLQQIPGTM